MCESGGRADAMNGSNVGGFQIHQPSHPQWSVAELLIPEVNVQAAYAIWSDQGWAPWACKPK